MNSTCCLKAFHSPTRSALSQLNLGLLDAVSILLFIYVLIWLHIGSVHQDASGLKHIPLLTPCYIFMWANISNRNSHVGRHVLFSKTITLVPPVSLGLYGLLPLYPLLNMYVLLHNIWQHTHTHTLWPVRVEPSRSAPSTTDLIFSAEDVPAISFRLQSECSL